MDDTSQQQLPPEPVQPEQPQQPPKKTILLVDDDQFIQVVYRDGFEEAGYTVITAEDGEAALEAIKTQRPNLVILDIIIPKINGFEVLKAVHADPTLNTIPVLVLTNLSQESDAQEARKYGAVDFISKFNVSFSDLVLRVQQLLV